jgi:transcriptional regulator with XRE-family HTH domain
VFLQKLQLPSTGDAVSPKRTKALIKQTKAWLKVTGIKRTELARRVGVTPQGLYNILNGLSEPTGEQALALSEIIRSKLD